MTDMDIKGRIHSVETLGLVDGPGLRFVAFLQGCHLRCLYCHNPDSWGPNDGKLIGARELALKIREYEPYIKNGGVTLSGGEPLLQSEFAAEVLRLCKKFGFHTACDTAGSVPIETAIKVLEQTDLVLLDIKDLDKNDCKKLCGISPKKSIDVLKYCEKVTKDVWIRHVLLPGYTLKQSKLERLADFLKTFSCVKKVELLPFHKMGEFKWKTLKIRYLLSNVLEPSKEEVEAAVEIFRSRGLKVD